LAAFSGLLSLFFLGFIAFLGLLAEVVGLLDPIDCAGSFTNPESASGKGGTCQEKGKNHCQTDRDGEI
jgi:hypothetical protein